MNDFLLFTRAISKRVAVLAMFSALCLFFSKLWLYALIAVIIAVISIICDKIIKKRIVASRKYTLIVVIGEEEETIPLVDISKIALELQYMERDIQRMNSTICFNALPGFILIESDETKSIKKRLERPLFYTSNYAELLRFIREKEKRV
ncbi:hypothetical protein [Heyndrickxia ginsengihumi]|uniref:Uncharacterized protein n=1 Tax=Heyndrickxia ginsengihumi TaxID=363870 RepID=A0A0A6VBE7_9BACI|nr:hypothetical protein [Heyndrickxia ginsengihumi]KHD84896.1 hypothetical protein NG54_12525 [Heyndrickxia ginsengihumi]MBE6184397.1 hypothetical protein [Bacillus sp. (in: firmicutes)]MCM3023116.1 hypothetical protein [Heyndrickxia ginsengihumi]NEY19954.1 hypothetical protein [Heyndrickxia ginsengihumi]